MEDISMMKILIVDDIEDNIEILLEILGEDFDVSVVLDGAQALEIIQEDLPDLILLDIMMPGIDGYEVCQKLKNNPDTKKIPVIFVTAKSEVVDETKGLEIGAVDFIRKPFSPQVVKARVKTQLKLKKFQEKVENTLDRHVHPSVAELILNDQVDVSGTMVNVTLLFADIRNFTTYAEQNHPKQVFKRINIYFSTMADIIEDFGGVVMQYVGDEIMAVFGAPIPYENHPEKAFLASLEMRLALSRLNETFQESDQPQLYHGIGIHTGPALAGIVGSADRQTYSMVGDTVNIASRVTDLCKVFKTDLLISQETYKLLTNHYTLLKHPSVTIKGRSEKLVVYQA